MCTRTHILSLSLSPLHTCERLVELLDYSFVGLGDLSGDIPPPPPLPKRCCGFAESIIFKACSTTLLRREREQQWNQRLEPGSGKNIHIQGGELGGRYRFAE